ncbi:hypothetical protein PLESTF_001131200 [Pleodorina starrii]|nr:hypothetical protein PLESTF_001131200 [Pleodorina starrii]
MRPARSCRVVSCVLASAPRPSPRLVTINTLFQVSDFDVGGDGGGGGAAAANRRRRGGAPVAAATASANNGTVQYRVQTYTKRRAHTRICSTDFGGGWGAASG